MSAHADIVRDWMYFNHYQLNEELGSSVPTTAKFRAAEAALDALEAELAHGERAFDQQKARAVAAEAERDEARRRAVQLETQQIADALNLRDTRLEAAEAERDRVLANMQDEVVQSILVREQLAAAEAEVARLREALEDIVNPRVGPTGGLSRSHGGTGFPVEIARAALAGDRTA